MTKDKAYREMRKAWYDYRQVKRERHPDKVRKAAHKRFVVARAMYGRLQKEETYDRKI